MKKIKPIEQISEELGISPNDLELYGKFKAKIPLENIKKNNNNSKLVVVTAITPTPLGEGKSTTAI